MHDIDPETMNPPSPDAEPEPQEPYASSYGTAQSFLANIGAEPAARSVSTDRERQQQIIQ